MTRQINFNVDDRAYETVERLGAKHGYKATGYAKMLFEAALSSHVRWRADSQSVTSREKSRLIPMPSSWRRMWRVRWRGRDDARGECVASRIELRKRATAGTGGSSTFSPSRDYRHTPIALEGGLQNARY